MPKSSYKELENDVGVSVTGFVQQPGLQLSITNYNLQLSMCLIIFCFICNNTETISFIFMTTHLNSCNVTRTTALLLRWKNNLSREDICKIYLARLLKFLTGFSNFAHVVTININDLPINSTSQQFLCHTAETFMSCRWLLMLAKPNWIFTHKQHIWIQSNKSNTIFWCLPT